MSKAQTTFERQGRQGRFFASAAIGESPVTKNYPWESAFAAAIQGTRIAAVPGSPRFASKRGLPDQR
jgi:hypothetical protein